MGEPTNRICIIGSSSKHVVRKILRKLEGKEFWWVYLGEDVSKAILIGQAMRGKGRRFEIAGLLQEAARTLRQPYIDYIGRLNLEQKSLMWWAYSLSERNPYVSKAFLHSCYIKMCTDILKKHPNKSFVFFVEKEAVRRAILANVQAGSLEHVRGLMESARAGLIDLKEFILHKGWFLLNNIHRLIVSKYVYRMQNRIKSQKPLVLIHSWLDQRSFDEKGRYHEIYFGKLPEFLRKKGKNVVIVPHVLSFPYRKAIKNMTASKDVFLPFHACLSLLDILKIFFITLANMPKRKSFPPFKDMDISEVIYEDLKMDWIRGRVASTMLFYYFVKHLKKKRLLVDMVIYTFENQAWEKVLCMAMREFYPQAHSVGYQHSTFSMMHLSHFFSKPESSIMPLPDKIVTSGEHAKNVFIKAGYPRKKVVRGGAMRYVCSLELRAKRRKVRDKLTILVALSINKFEAAELIWKVLKAFENRAEFKVIIKCHPLMPLEKISKLLKMRLPAHFTISDKSITDLLKESDVLLYTGSTACVEAIAADIPVVHVESDLLIDLDKLDFDPTIRPSARSVEEITERVEDIINVTEEQLSKGRKKWRDVVKNLFGKVDDSTYRLFLPEV